MKIELDKPTRAFIHFLFSRPCSYWFPLLLRYYASSICSAQVVFSTLLFEEVKFLERFHSVDSKNEFSIFWHTESLHGILELNIVEDDWCEVGSILFGESFFWSGLSGGEEVAGVVHDGCGNLGAEFSSVIVSFSLGERDSEREILWDLIKISLHWCKELSLWVLKYLSGVSSGSFVSSDVFIRDGISSNIWESWEFESTRLINEKSNCERNGEEFHYLRFK